MRRMHILAAAAIVALSTATPRPAHAILGAGDIVFDPTVYAEAILQYEQLVQQLQQLEQTYTTLARQVETGNLAGILNSPLLRNAMPGYGQTAGLLHGNGQFAGAEQFMTQNRYYRPQGTDFTATEMLRTAQGIANIQAIAQRNLQSLEQRIEGLGELKDQIDGVTSNGDIAAVHSRIASEQTFVATQAAQASQLQVMLMAQSQVNQQRIDQKMRQDAEDQARATGGLNGGGNAGDNGAGNGATVPAFMTAGGG